MVTAKGQEQDVVLGLNLGADDYVVKPFQSRRADRAGARVSPAPRHGSDGDPLRRLRARSAGEDAVARRGARSTLTAKEFKLLAYFASRPGCALARDTILNAVWGSAVFVTPRSIDRCVATLRAKVEPDPHHPTYIQTIRDIGYRFDPAP